MYEFSWCFAKVSTVFLSGGKKKQLNQCIIVFFWFFFLSQVAQLPTFHQVPNRDTDKGRRVKGANEKVCVVPLGYYAFKSLNQVNNKMPMEASVNGEKTGAQTMEGSISGWKSITEPVLGIEICGLDSLKSDLQGGR